MNRPQREMLIEDLMLTSGTFTPAYASVKVRVRFDAEGWPYLYEIIDMATDRSLAFPSAFEELIELEIVERYAPRVLEEA